MSEEIRVTDANLAELARLRVDLASLRAALEQSQREVEAERAARRNAEADTAALEQAITHYLDDVAVSPLTLNESLRTHPGSAFLAELDAARAVVEAMRSPLNPPHVERLFAAYDAVVKAGRI